MHVTVEVSYMPSKHSFQIIAVVIIAFTIFCQCSGGTYFPEEEIKAILREHNRKWKALLETYKEKCKDYPNVGVRSDKIISKEAKLPSLLF